MSFSKKFGQLKQWTGERFGSTGRTEAPVDFKKLEEATESRKECIERVYGSLEAYLKTLDKKRISKVDTFMSKHLPVATFGQYLVEHGKLIGEDTALGMNLVRVGKTESQIGVYQLEFLQNGRKDYLVPLNHLISQLRIYQDMKKKCKNRRLDYDAKYNKFSKDSYSHNKSLIKEEEEMKAAQFKYEESLNDLQGLMESFSGLEVGLDGQLAEFLRDQHLYHTRCAQALAETLEKFGDTASADAAGQGGAGGLGKAKSDTSLCSGAQAAASRAPGKRSSCLPDISSARAGRSASGSGSEASGARSDGAAAKRRVCAMYPFTAESADELSLAKGDVVEVLEMIDEGWWIGKNESGVVGMFPSNYVMDADNAADADTGSKAAPPPSYIEVVKEADDVSWSTAGAGREAKMHKEMGSLSIAQPAASPVPQMGPCGSCGCSEFVANVFKPKGHCNNCFHQHGAR